MRYGCLWRSAEACSTPHNLPAPDLVVPGSGHQEVGLGVEAQARDGVIRRLNDLVRLVRVGIGKSGAGQEGGHRSPMRMEVPPILSLSLCVFSACVVGMATCFSPLSISPGGSHLKARDLGFLKSTSLRTGPRLNIQKKSNEIDDKRRISVRAEYHDGGRGGGSDFVAGFLLGGAIFGTLAYVFAPQIRRSLLNEDEYGFRRAKRPIYYDEGLEKTRQTLNAKISQLNSAIDNVSSRLRGGNNAPNVPIETDPEVEATL